MNKTIIQYDSQKATNLILKWAMPFVAFFIIIFYFLWKKEVDFSNKLNIIQDHILSAIFIFFASVLVHELLHALVYIIFESKNIKAVSFGFSKKTLSPYCHYAKRVKLWKYKISLTIPGLVLGIFPLLISLVIGNFYLLIYGVIFTLGAFGDFYILWKLRKYKYSAYINDNPDKMGCTIEE